MSRRKVYGFASFDSLVIGGIIGAFVTAMFAIILHTALHGRQSCPIDKDEIAKICEAGGLMGMMCATIYHELFQM
jgi:hypothetical protein